jgi:RsiW-degrading membrane proteinase PrsW (M82 family)
VLGGALAEEEVKTIWLRFFAVVEQQLKKCCSGKLILGWFSCLGLGLTAGRGLKRYGKV